MIRPHGGTLVDRVLTGDEAEHARQKAAGLPAIEVSLDRAKEIENIAHGILSPLTGFMGEQDYKSVLHDMRLANGLPWSIPIVLEVPEDSTFAPGDEVALATGGQRIALMSIEERFVMDPEEHSRHVFGTTDERHPGVASVNRMHRHLLGGPILLFDHTPVEFPEETMYPKDTRAAFEERGWKTVVGFQTRNVPHVGHEFVQKTALSHVDGLFINPVVGPKKSGDFLDRVIIDSYRALMENYYPADRVVLGVLNTEMRYAGPREAIFHAIMRKNFGCTHFIVGRDHAGVGDFYEPFAAQEIFGEVDDLEIQPVFFRSFFYCKHCGGPANEKTCPHEGDEIINFSGTLMRQMLTDGKIPPPEQMRREVAEVLIAADELFVP